MNWSQETVGAVATSMLNESRRFHGLGDTTLDKLPPEDMHSYKREALAALSAVAQCKEVQAKDAALIKARDALQLCRPDHVTRPAIKAINEVLSAPIVGV